MEQLKEKMKNGNFKDTNSEDFNIPGHLDFEDPEMQMKLLETLKSMKVDSFDHILPLVDDPDKFDLPKYESSRMSTLGVLIALTSFLFLIFGKNAQNIS